MIELKEIKISDKEFFSKFLPESENSMMNFTTIFAWSANGKIKYDVVDDCLVLFFKSSKNGACCTYPQGDGNRVEAARKALSYMKENSKKPRFILMTEDNAKELYENFGNEFKICSNRDSADYVYLSEDLINLSGKKFHQKKNHLNAFLNTYQYEYKKIEDENINECIDLLDKWLKTQPPEVVEYSKIPSLKILENAKELGVTVGGIYVDGELIAFSVGEAQTPNMALIHLEYANTEFRGAFNIINQQFTKNEWSSFKYINREEDMGLEGLRKAKMAYRPVKMIEKYYGEYKGR